MEAKMDWDNESDKSASWREAAEKALLRGKIDEAYVNIDKAFVASGRTVDLLMKADLLWAAGDVERFIAFIEDNMYRFEADLSPRERKGRLDPLLRKGGEYFLKTANALYEADRYQECAEFAQLVLTKHAVFLSSKKHRELFEFAWSSSYDELLKQLYADRQYELCIAVVDDVLGHYRKLTTWGQRNRYRKLRAFAYFRQGEYGKGLFGYLTVPSVVLTICLLLVMGLSLKLAFNAISGSVMTSVRQVTAKVESPAKGAATVASPTAKAVTVSRRAEIKSITLFEADANIPLVGARKYQTEFSRQSKRIFVEVLYRNLNFRVADATLPLIIQYYGPSGALLQEIVSTSSPKKEIESAITSLGWRPEENAAWPSGRYIVKVTLDGVLHPDIIFEVR